MIIVFNIYAVLQAIVLGAIIALLYFLNIEGLFHYLNITDNQGTALLSYPAFFLITAMDLNGIKGRLFFIPTWVFILLLPLFLVNSYDAPVFYWVIRALAPLLLMHYAYRQNRRFNRNFEKAQVAVQQMQHAPTETAEDRKQFWAMASHALIKPSWFFLYANGIFSAIWHNSVSMEQFTDHYRRLIPLIRPQVYEQEQIIKLDRFEYELGQPEYKHHSGSLENIGDIISAKYKALG